MSARSGAKSQVPAKLDDDPSVAARALSQIIERGARVQAPAVKAYVDRLREHNPNASPAEIVGKLLPVGIGAVVGGVGNRAMGKKIISNARGAFGNPPPRWPAALHVLRGLEQ